MLSYEVPSKVNSVAGHVRTDFACVYCDSLIGIMATQMSLHLIFAIRHERALGTLFLTASQAHMVCQIFFVSVLIATLVAGETARHS